MDSRSLLTRALGEVRDIARFALVAVPAYFAFTTVAFANYVIPSESMTPTIEVGDRVVVSKFAYGYSRYSLPIPIARIVPAASSRLLGVAPQRGDVVVFQHPRQDRVMIKRLIGLPGDVISVERGVLHVNGAPVPRAHPEDVLRAAHRAGLEHATRYRETLPGGAVHAIHEFADDAPFDDFGPVTVPAGHFFAMGDNRDNSLDSRWEGMGSTPMENLIGRAETVYFTLPHLGDRTGLTPPEPRLFRPLRRTAP
jgi:signal peptidase I